MAEIAARYGRDLTAFVSVRLAQNGRRLLVLLAIAAVLASSPEIARLLIKAMADAYLQVSVFVAATLAVFYSAERFLKRDLGSVMARNGGWQPAIAACLGALPGCGGAIIVVTQFTRGNASFGALISVLVATMGDAGFLLIAREPQTALLVMAIGVVAGTVAGWLVDRLHGPDFMRADRDGGIVEAAFDRVRAEVPLWARRIWFALLVPGLVLGALQAFQLDADALLGVDGLTLWFGFVGAAFAIALWALPGSGNSHGLSQAAFASTGTRIMADTNFVTAWVMMAFLSYELAVFAAGADVSALFRSWAGLMPLVAVLVGFVPGCGPQIVVTTLYLAGAVPLSAQLANAIANDGDALFPAIALAPRAAILATLYSAVPALIVGYGWFLLVE
jgi:hypothetical protein